MSKIYLLGMTGNEEKNISELTAPIYKHVDGLIFVDHDSRDSTYDILKERVGKGKIIRSEWVPHHDHQMNKALFSGVLKPGDWFILRDSMERFNEKFARGIRKVIDQFEVQKMESVFNCGNKYHNI